MEKEEFAKELKKEAEILKINLTNEQVDKFFHFMDILIEWNEKINLTAITEPNEIIKKHFIDSLTILPYINENNKVIDIGTGAGFPGIPIKIANSNSEITLLDSLNKRLIFIEEVIKVLELKNIGTIHGRAEDFGKDKKYREQYDIATSRAVAPLNVLSEYLLPFVKVGGCCLCMKGSNIEEEISQSKKSIEILGGKIEKVDKFYLPESDIIRNIIIIKKLKNTPNQYPRKAGVPSKNPI